MINRVVLVGRITKDLELKHTQSQNPVAFVSFTLAVNRNFSNQNGEKDADFIRCTAWRKTAENLAKFMGKGNLIGLEGRIQTSFKEDASGKREFFVDVVADNVQFLEKSNQQTSSEGSYSQTGQQGYGQPGPSYQQQSPGYGDGNQQSGYQQGGYQQGSYQQGGYQQTSYQPSGNVGQQYVPNATNAYPSDDDLPF